jgi:hypothetical protein
MTRPAEHAQASESGLNSGIAAAHIWAQAAAERERLQEAEKRSDMEAALQRERLQQKSIYDAQSIAVDVAKNKAAASMAEARLKQTQENAARVAQQWSQNLALNQQKAAQVAEHQKILAGQGQAKIDLSQKRFDLAQDRLDEATDLGQQRIDISRKNAEDLARHRKAMEDRGPGGSAKLPPEVQPDDDLLKQRIAQSNADIKAVNENLRGNPNNEKWKAALDKLTQHRDDLVLQRKKLRGYTGFKPVMGKRQEADETSSARFDVSPLDEEDQDTEE